MGGVEILQGLVQGRLAGQGRLVEIRFTLGRAVGTDGHGHGAGNRVRRHLAQRDGCRVGRGQVHFFALLALAFEDHPLALGMNAEGPVADSPRDVEGRLRHAVARQFQRVGRHTLAKVRSTSGAAPKKRSAGTRPSIP